MSKKAPNYMHDQLDHAYAEGYLDGQEDGQEDGYIKGYRDGGDDMIDILKPAVSAALRNGSSEGADGMNAIKKRKKKSIIKDSVVINAG